MGTETTSFKEIHEGQFLHRKNAKLLTRYMTQAVSSEILINMLTQLKDAKEENDRNSWEVTFGLEGGLLATWTQNIKSNAAQDAFKTMAISCLAVIAKPLCNDLWTDGFHKKPSSQKTSDFFKICLMNLINQKMLYAPIQVEMDVSRDRAIDILKAQKQFEILSAQKLGMSEEELCVAAVEYVGFSGKTASELINDLMEFHRLRSSSTLFDDYEDDRQDIAQDNISDFLRENISMQALHISDDIAEDAAKILMQDCLPLLQKQGKGLFKFIKTVFQLKEAGQKGRNTTISQPVEKQKQMMKNAMEILKDCIENHIKTLK